MEADPVRFVSRPQGGSGSASHPSTITYPSTIHHQSCASKSLSRIRIAGNPTTREPTAVRLSLRIALPISDLGLLPSQGDMLSFMSILRPCYSRCVRMGADPVRFVSRPQGGSGSASHPSTITYPSTIHHQSCA